MRKYRAKIKEVGGKKILVIETQSEEIIDANGNKSVIIHAPKLDTINKFIPPTKK